jgi:hypothetical protein
VTINWAHLQSSTLNSVYNKSYFMSKKNCARHFGLLWEGVRGPAGGEMRASERRMREVAIRHGSDEATRRRGGKARRQGDEVTRRRGDETRRRDGDRNGAQTNDDQNGIEQTTVGPNRGFRLNDSNNAGMTLRLCVGDSTHKQACLRAEYAYSPPPPPPPLRLEATSPYRCCHLHRLLTTLQV